MGSDPSTPVADAVARADGPSSGLALGLLSLGHAVIHAQSALMPLIYPIIIVEFALNERDIGLFIAITTAVGGAMQLLYGFLTRYVPRPTLLAGGQLVFGGGLLLGGLAQSVGQLLGSISLARIGASPAAPGRQCASSPTRFPSTGADSPSAPISPAATWAPSWCRSSAGPCCCHRSAGR